MKLARGIEGDRIRVAVRGEVDGSRCDCLERFWERQVIGPAEEVYVEMSEVNIIDGLGVAAVVNLARRSLACGAHVVFDAPPQMLAHTLYKVGMLVAGGGVTLVNPRTEEPYAG